MFDPEFFRSSRPVDGIAEIVEPIEIASPGFVCHNMGCDGRSHRQSSYDQLLWSQARHDFVEDLSITSHEDVLRVRGSSQSKFGLHVRKVEFDGEETSARHFDMEKCDEGRTH